MRVEVDEPAAVAACRSPLFDDFVRLRGDRLLELAWLVTRHPEDARDAVQDALVALYPRWSKLPLGDEFEAYVYRTVVNACLRVIKRRPRALAVAEPEQLRSALVTVDAAAAALADEVWHVCGALSPNQRAAVILRFRQDLTFAEIAKSSAVAKSLPGRTCIARRRRCVLGCSKRTEIADDRDRREVPTGRWSRPLRRSLRQSDPSTPKTTP